MPPHIVHFLADDFGWAHVGWHRNKQPHDNVLTAHDDVSTPNLDALAADGLILDRHYAHKICSPSRCAIQTGRAPIHVNVQNVLPESVNPKDPIGGYQGIPLNMSGMATVLRRGGYRTHLVGKWDVGMATELHHPKARGYESFFGYWHHANDYWTNVVESCLGNTSSTGRTSSSSRHHVAIRDLWRFNASFDGPASDSQNGVHCSQHNQAPVDEPCVYEEELLAREAAAIIARHEPSEPLFLFYSSHLIHVPLQVPVRYEAAFASVRDPFRRIALAMGNFLDDQVGSIVGALKARGMWETTLFTFHADNGGEIMGAGLCGGNNWPLTGGKFSNWEGGIRVNAFVAGGALPVARRGATESALTAVWDWLATYAFLAGVDPTDHAAAAAGLPPIDSANLWPLLSQGSDLHTAPPRSEVVIGETTALSPNGDGRTLVGGLLQQEGPHGGGEVATGGQKLYKLLLGAPDRKFTIDQYVRTGPSWPNASSRLVPLSHFKTCGRDAVSGCLFELTSDPYEQRNLAAALPQRFEAMLARMDTLQATVYSPVRGRASPRACKAATTRYGGYWGPFLGEPAPGEVQSAEDAASPLAPLEVETGT